jgi:hypothetical protein
MLIADYFRKQADALYSLARGTTRAAAAQMEPVTNTVVGSSYVYTVLFRSERSDAKVRPRWWRLTHASSDRYHPERHYMRGPGPKWREKHAAKRPAR